MKELFVPKKFGAKALATIAAANTIIREYQGHGIQLTLRQLYYQFVSRDLIPNSQASYKNLGSVINDGRLAGLIDWDSIADRTREVEKPSVWDDPAQIITAVSRQYKEDVWASQPRHIEVWIEKDALLSVIEPICRKWRVPFFACRGYSSQSAQYEAGKRLANASFQGQMPLVLHLGDHDPSGIDMTRDNTDRLSMFAEEPIQVERLALNMDQVSRYKPPPNPAKATDARFEDYAAQFGTSCWELDALDPLVIQDLIDTEIASYVDDDAWETAMAAEKVNRDLLGRTADRWNDVATFLTPKAKK